MIEIKESLEDRGANDSISFLEFTLEIDKQYVQALKVFANVKNQNEEKTRKEWKSIYKNLLVKRTN